MGSTISYKNNQISSFNTGTKTLKTSGKYMEDDVTVNVSDNNLIASNIKHGIDIFGITGTFKTRIGVVTATPSSRGATITFTGLQAEPLAFACYLAAQGTISKSYRTCSPVVYDGTTVRNFTFGVSGSSTITYTYTNCTFSYSNGSLTITSPSTGTNGYFQAMQHYLMYVYEQ